MEAAGLVPPVGLEVETKKELHVGYGYDSISDHIIDRELTTSCLKIVLSKRLQYS